MHKKEKIDQNQTIDLGICFLNPKNGKPYTYEQVCILQDYDGPRTDPNAILKNYDNDRAAIDYQDDIAIRKAIAETETKNGNKLFP